MNFKNSRAKHCALERYPLSEWILYIYDFFQENTVKRKFYFGKNVHSFNNTSNHKNKGKGKCLEMGQFKESI